MAAEHVIHGRAAAAIGHVLISTPALLAEHGHGEMAERADADRGIFHRARLRLRRPRSRRRMSCRACPHWRRSRRARCRRGRPGPGRSRHRQAAFRGWRESPRANRRSPGTRMPSGGLFATCAAPSEPAAPDLFSTITMRLSFVCKVACSSRASASVEPPGGNGTTSVMVVVDCAHARTSGQRRRAREHLTSRDLHCPLPECKIAALFFSALCRSEARAGLFVFRPRRTEDVEHARAFAVRRASYAAHCRACARNRPS